MTRRHRPEPARGAYRSPSLAAFLSFLVPGLGQWYAGRRRPAVLFAAPVVALGLIVVVQAVTGVEQLAALLITPSSALTIVILIGLLAAWRILAIADAIGRPGPGRQHRRRPVLVLLGLVLTVAVTHGAAGYVAWAFYDAGSKIFVGQGPEETPEVPRETGGVATDDPDREYGGEPFATPESPTARITVLLTGVDSAESRNHALTDTMIVLSLDPGTGNAAMLSFPRDISDFTMTDGRVYTGKVNSLMTYARLHPKEFPDGPLPSLARELGHIVGVPIHYYAAVDLAGFRKIIDAVDGITVDNPKAIDDPRYDWLDGRRGFTLAAGPQTLDGRTALAYVRSRQGVGDTDYTRAARQQQVLVALRSKMTDPAMITRLPAILSAVGDTVKTNFPSDRVPEMIDLAQAFDDEHLTRVVLGPPYSKHPPTSTTGGIWKLRLDMKLVQRLSSELFGDDSRYASR